jgi:hypothetical protein
MHAPGAPLIAAAVVVIFTGGSGLPSEQAAPEHILFVNIGPLKRIRLSFGWPPHDELCLCCEIPGSIAR